MRFKVLTIAAALFAASPLLASNISFNQIITFGDSLSDNGNAYIESGGTFPGSNYAMTPYGYYTDGPNTTPSTGSGPVGLWVDQFSKMVGVADPQPFAAGGGGTNYAVASAMTGTTNPQDIQNIINNYFLPSHGGAAPASALYTFLGGANDINDALGPNPLTAIAAGKAAADNIESEIMQVHSAGGQYFLWFNLPSLGETPAALEAGALVSGEANLATQAFNAEYALDLQTLLAQGIDVIPVDLNTLFNEIILDPSAYGFNDVTDGCISTASYTSMNPCTSTTNPNKYLFWDDEHPTTAGDALIADAAFDAINAPEPATYALLMLGGFGLFTFCRLRNKAI